LPNALIFTVLSAVITAAIGCARIVLMKRPAFVADAYELDDVGKPGAEEANRTIKSF